MSQAKPTHEIYRKQKYMYLLTLSQHPRVLIFANVLAAVRYVNRLCLLPDVQLLDYSRVILDLRKGIVVEYSDPSLRLALRQVVVYGVTYQSQRLLPDASLSSALGVKAD